MTADLLAPRAGPDPAVAAAGGAPLDARLFGLWGRALGVLLALYLLFDRGVAHVHLPGTTAYLGELLLAAGLVAAAVGPRFVHRALQGDALLAVLVGFMAWGVLRAVPNLGRFGVVATVHDSALFYYGLFAVLVVAACEAVPDLPGRLVRGFSRLLPWLTVWLPVTFLLSKLGVRIPAVPLLDDAPLLDHKGGNVAVVAAVCLAYLLAVPDQRWRGTRRWALALVNVGTIGLATTQTRGGGLAAVVGVALAVALLPARRRARMAARGLAMVLVVVVVAAASGLSLATHKRQVSFSTVVAEVSSLLGPGQGAGQPGSGKLTGTEEFRLHLWDTILDRQASSGRLVTGFGFGPNLASLGGVRESHGADSVNELRSAHNSHIDVLARMGLLGAFGWVLLWAGWLTRMVRARRRYREAGRPAERALTELMVVAVVAVMVNAFFDPTFESAQVAAVAWTVFGLGVVHARRSLAAPAVR